MGASGLNLSQRVEMIMTLLLRFPLTRSGKAVLIAAGIFAMASPVAAGSRTSSADGGAGADGRLQLAQLQSAQPDDKSSGSASTPPAAHQAGSAHGRKPKACWTERYGCTPEQDNPARRLGNQGYSSSDVFSPGTANAASEQAAAAYINSATGAAQGAAAAAMAPSGR